MKPITTLVALMLGALLPAINVSAEEPLPALQSKLQKALEAAQKNDETALAGICKELVLPKPDVWFASQFGDVDGVKIASAYTDMNVATAMPGLFQQLAKKGQTEIRLKAIKDKDDTEGTGHQREALARMKSPVVLYSARFVVPGEESGMHIYSFAEVDGGMRFLGKMQVP